MLNLSQAVDDTAWPTPSRGTLYLTDAANDSVDTVRGPFVAYRPVAVATPCGSNHAPASCSASPASPANFLASLDPATGQVTAITVEGAAYAPQGSLLFVAGGYARGGVNR